MFAPPTRCDPHIRCDRRRVVEPSPVVAKAFRLGDEFRESTLVTRAHESFMRANATARLCQQCQDDPAGDGGRQHRVDPVHDAAVSGKQRAHVLDAEIAFHL